MSAIYTCFAVKCLARRELNERRISRHRFHVGRSRIALGLEPPLKRTVQCRVTILVSDIETEAYQSAAHGTKNDRNLVVRDVGRSDLH